MYDVGYKEQVFKEWYGDDRWWAVAVGAWRETRGKSLVCPGEPWRAETFVFSLANFASLVCKVHSLTLKKKREREGIKSSAA